VVTFFHYPKTERSEHVFIALKQKDQNMFYCPKTERSEHVAYGEDGHQVYHIIYVVQRLKDISVYF
jgi:hypothetical protein